MRRIVSVFLCYAVLLALLPLGASAAEGTTVSTGRHPAQTVEYDSPSYRLTAMENDATGDTRQAQTCASSDFTYQTMTSSQNLLDLIKDCEGFSPTPYWDYSHWAIGYGTGCGSTRDDVPPEYWKGITEAKGEELLMDYLSNTAEAEVNRFFKRIGRQPLQQQFDAMVDFTYALGGSWMYEDSRVAAWLENPTTEIELMRALGAWCRVDGKVSASTCNRRVREALIYLYGLYLLPYGAVDSELQVVGDGNLPVFKYVIYDGNGTTLINTRTDDVNYYFEDQAYGSLISPTRSGYTFSGWKRTDGFLLLEGHTVRENIRVTAAWTILPFTDVPNWKWYATPVAYCFDNGIMNGTSLTEFQPDAETSRAMVVTVLYRMAREPEVSGSSGLSDVSQDRYYTEAVTWAVQNGVVTGYTDGTFRPDTPVTRDEMVTFLYRYAKTVLNADVTASDLLSRYEDGNQVSGFARDAMNWALDRGFINGVSQTSYVLAPKDTATRAQLAKVLMCLENME